MRRRARCSRCRHLGARSRSSSLLVATGAARADEAAAWAALRQGGVVALMRHGDAPGVGDPARLATSTTARPSATSASEAAPRRARSAPGCAPSASRSPACSARRGAAASTPRRSSASARCRSSRPSPMRSSCADRREALREGGRAVIGRWRGPGVLAARDPWREHPRPDRAQPGDRGDRRRRARRRRRTARDRRPVPLLARRSNIRRENAGAPGHRPAAAAGPATGRHRMKRRTILQAPALLCVAARGARAVVSDQADPLHRPGRRRRRQRHDRARRHRALGQGCSARPSSSTTRAAAAA